MATVGCVLGAFAGLDPTTEVRLMQVERNGEVSTFVLAEIDEVHVEHDARTGAPQAVWLVARSAEATSTSAAIPRSWPVRRNGCGCVISVPVRPASRVSTMAVRCPHYEPSRVALAAAERSS